MTARPVVQVLRPTFEHHYSGFGVQYERPRISWRFQCVHENVRDWEQYAYDIEIRNDGEENGVSFHGETNQSILVPWPSACASLVSRDRRQVRVRCHGTFAEGAAAIQFGVTEWSEWSAVEAALLRQDDWKAEMISPPDVFKLAADGSARLCLFRKCFDVTKDKKVSSARLYVTGHGVYQAYLNGDQVGDHCMAPGWQTYKHRLHYQIFDVSGMLEAGARNVVGLEVGPGWFASGLTWAYKRFIYGEELGVLVQLEIIYEDGEHVTVLSNDSWLCHPSPTISSEIYTGEVFDSKLEREIDGWETFAAFKDQHWQHVKISNQRPSRLVSPDTPPAKVTQRMRPIKIWTSPSGKTLVDFGQNIVGRVHIRRLRRPAGTKVILRHAEVLEDGEISVKSLGTATATDTLICDGNVITDWAPKFTFHGFRYVEITGWSLQDKEEPLTTTGLFTEVVHSDMERTGWFSCSNEDVNKLHENVVWGMRGNFLSIPSGAPQRSEKLGWTGDLNIFAPSAGFLYKTTGLLKNWLQDLEADQMSDSSFWTKGVVPLVVPNCIAKEEANDTLWCATPMGIWGDAAVMVPWCLYTNSGDTAFLQQQFASMTAWLDRGIPRGSGDLWSEDIWQFGDWLDPSAPPNDSGRGRTNSTFAADAFLYHITLRAAEIAQRIGNEGATTKYQEEASSIKQQFQEKYLTPAGLLASDSQTAYALALAFDIIDNPVQRATAVARLVQNIKHNDFHPTTGFVGTQYLLSTLTQTGHPDVAYRMLLEPSCPSFLYPVRMGATTIWERWDSVIPPSASDLYGDGSASQRTTLSDEPAKRNLQAEHDNYGGRVNPATMNSFNHCAFGSVVHWLYSNVGGISPLEPGWQTFQVKPTPNVELGHAEVAYEGPYGRIECRWTLDGSVSVAFNVRDHSALDDGHDEKASTTNAADGFEKVENKTMLMKIYMLVPPNSRAFVVLPENQRAPPRGMMDIEKEEEKKDGCWVGSGRHVFETVFVQKGLWPPEAFLPPWGRAEY